MARGDQGIDQLDAACKIHDIDYTEAQTVKDVRSADKKFLKNVNASNADKVRKNLIKGIFKAKMLGEDVGVLKGNEFADVGNKMGEQDADEITGQGRRRKQDPIRKLRKKARAMSRRKDVNKILKQIKRKIKK